MNSVSEKDSSASLYNPSETKSRGRIIDNITDFIVLCDKDYQIIRSNRSADVILGGGISLVGSHCYEKFRGLTEPCEDCMLPETLANTYVVSLETYDSRFNEYFEERAYPIMSDSGESDEFILVGRNISKTKKREEKRIEEKISSGIVHDFNNMLTGIIGRVRLLIKQISDPKQLKDLKSIELSAMDCATTVKKIQDFTSGTSDERYETVNLFKFVSEVISLHNHLWEEEDSKRGIIIKSVVDIPRDIDIDIIPHDLRRAFGNIIINAVHAMTDGGILKITSESLDKATVINFIDTGCGMTKEIIDNIFSPFFSTKGTRGTGMGMTEVYSIVKKHNGTISIESTVGKGTTIKITLPTTHAVQVEEMDFVSLPTKNAVIMVIDDNEFVLETVTEQLADLGHEVGGFTSATEAIEHFSNQPSEIILTDLGMPEMSGWEVAAKIKEINSRTVVVLYSGWTIDMEQDELNAKGVDLFLKKPFRTEDLGRMVYQAKTLFEKIE